MELSQLVLNFPPGVIMLRENLSLCVLLDKPGENIDPGASFIAGVLKPSYSVLGSNKRAKEELMVVKFREFSEIIFGFCKNPLWSMARPI